MPMEPRIDQPRDQFPIGMRVLAVDDDPTCLLLLDTLLRRCQYHVTTTGQAITALKLLRENKDKFDLVISDVHMPDMDGFKLLELVGLEMDLPVIMLSANSDPKLVMKGISHGACDYLLKPIRIEELKNIWQHVIRRKRSGNSDNQERSRHGDGGQALSANSDQSGRNNKRRKDQDEEDDDENDESGHDNEDPSSQKKPRVVWSVDLHRKFVGAVNQLGIDKAVPKKILDLMNVEKLTRENVASHLQKYRLYLKRISSVANQQANMAAALGNTDSPYLQVGSMNGLGTYNTLAGSGQFQSNAFRPFPPPSGMLGRLNTSAGLGMHGLPSSGVVHMGHAQNSSNSANDPGKFQPGLFSGNHNGSILQGMPMSLELDQLQINKGVACVGGVSSAANDMTIFPVSSGFPDRVTLGSSSNPLLGVPSNPLTIGGNLQESQVGRKFGNQPSLTMPSLSSDLSSRLPDHGRCNSNWSNAVHSSGVQSNSFPLSDYFQQASLHPTANSRDKMSTMTLPIVSNSSGPSVPAQLQYQRTDLQCQAAPLNINSGQNINNASPQGWNEHRQDAPYRPNFMSSSTNSLAPVNGALGSLGQTSNPQNTVFSGSMDINLMRQSSFLDTLPARLDEVDNSAIGASAKLQEGYLMGQTKPQGGFASNNFGSLEDIATAMMRQDQGNARPEGDFGSM